MLEVLVDEGRHHGLEGDARRRACSSLDDGVSVDAIEIYVHRLRKKLEGSDATIVTLRGLGYVLRPVHRGA